MEIMPCSITDGIQYDDDDREADFNEELDAVIKDIALSLSIAELRFEPEIRRVDFFAVQAN